MKFEELEEIKFQSAVGDICDPGMTCSTEVTSSSYRTIDGSCNNLEHPEWGKSKRQQRRVMEQTYEDGKTTVPTIRNDIKNKCYKQKQQTKHTNFILTQNIITFNKHVKLMLIANETQSDRLTRRRR